MPVGAVGSCRRDSHSRNGAGVKRWPLAALPLLVGVLCIDIARGQLVDCKGSTAKESGQVYFVPVLPSIAAATRHMQAAAHARPQAHKIEGLLVAFGTAMLYLTVPLGN